MRKYIFCIVMLITMYIIPNIAQASTKKIGIENFPVSYQPYLREVEKKHPNWKFIALYTNLDWTYVVNKENKFGKNLVPKNYFDSWKNTTPGQYNVPVDGDWVDCSRQAIEYSMDPRNFLNEGRILQFEALSYDASTNNMEGIDKILYGTEFYQRKVSYLDSNGNTINMNDTYAGLIFKGANISKVSPYHLAARIKQEVGPFLSHSSISGNVEGFKGLYNFYNIGATSSTEPMGAIKNGLRYAKDGKGASEAIRNKYLIPWNNKEKSIAGGGIFIGASYINVGQNTVYLQKFDVNDERNGTLFEHQYMTNVLAPFTEAKNTYNGYKQSGLLESSISLIIPVYDNMRDIQVDSPNINQNDFIQDNQKAYCNGNSVNIRTGPSTSYEIITKANKGDKMTRIARGISSGERWDKVILANGIVGYIYQTYLTELPNVQIERIELSLDDTRLQKGDIKSLNITILPEEAKSNKVNYKSSNPNVVTVDDKGSICAIRSGNAEIIASAEENRVESRIEVQVYTKVEKVILNEKEIYMQKDDTFKITGYVMPEDADDNTIIYTSANEEVATISQDGLITALQEGDTTIIAKSKENSNIQAKCSLSVVRKMEDSEIYFDSSLTVNSLEITGIDYNENTVEDIKNKITTDLEIEIVNYKDELLKNDDVVGTGSKIRVKEGGKILRQYKIIVYGDANGDGKINSIDLLVIQRHILEIEQLEDVFLKASNVRKNNKKPTSLDLLIIQRHILTLETIEQ